ncbi:thiol-disulfide oxidoreductase DCC family protein [Paenibacillus urinalis]|uniref:thiol-disulfide oxidoreductase DCC family protein n=1 Tax=Paenibacillus urinalis TaxID=521520 RepID=UPI00195F9EBC
MQNYSDKHIVLIDGVCHLCQGITKWIIQRDSEGVFYFASLQSEVGRRLLEQGGLSVDALDTFVYIEKGRYHTRSTAALKVARRLKFPYYLAYGFIIVPKFIRDIVYNFIARNRYRWFGRDGEDACMLPTPEIRERFL